MSRQYIDGAGFSLERLTDSVPADGRYYLLLDGGEVRVFETQEEAQQAYHELCYAYWTAMLTSADQRERLQAARGLLRRDRRHRCALETLASHGDARERAYASETLKRMDRQPPPA